jgi:N,N'-diacetyllegionaminate synthase
VSFVEIAGRRIGAGAPVFVIAEAGVNHNGDQAKALRLVDAAAASGADAVKFQTFDPNRLASRAAPLAEYQRAGESPELGQVAMLSRLRLPDDALAAVAMRCRERGILFLSTPFDEVSADLLDELDVPAFKIGSGELTNLPFLRNLASRGRPLLLSTGMATLGEVAAAVDAVAASGAHGLVLLHCVSSYPAPAKEANLRAMDTLREAFSVPVGYSDHCLGTDVALAAVARDAAVLERHLTLDRCLPGPDHALSLEPGELAELMHRIRTLERALGDGRKRPQRSEYENLLVARRSIVAARAMQPGERIDAAALTLKRPGGGLPPSRLASVVGVRLVRPIEVDELLTEAHLESEVAGR